MSDEVLSQLKYYDVDVETWVIPGKVRISRAAVEMYKGEMGFGCKAIYNWALVITAGKL